MEFARSPRLRVKKPVDNQRRALLDYVLAASSRNPKFEAFKSMPTSRVESDLPFTQSKEIWRKGSDTRCINQPIETEN
jgi:hypothetical protein